MTIANEFVVRRSRLRGSPEAYSGATIELVELADGRRVVLKHLPPDGDWLTRASGRRDRLQDLWREGLLEHVSHVVDHAVIDVIHRDGHDVVVMRDVTDQLLPTEGAVSRLTSRRVLAGLAAFHAAGRTAPRQELCPIAARYGMFAPAVHAADCGPGSHPSREFIVEGWARLADVAASDVFAAVVAVHTRPSILGDRLASFPATLLHGDAKFANLGLGPTGLVAVDWGDLTGFGPVEIDVGWYAMMNAPRLGGTFDDVFADYAAAAGRPLDTDALDLVCIGSFAQMGFKIGARATSADPTVRAGGMAELLSWTRRVRGALERSGLT